MDEIMISFTVTQNH